jgi:hypothetical protein
MPHRPKTIGEDSERRKDWSLLNRSITVLELVQPTLKAIPEPAGKILEAILETIIRIGKLIQV